MNDGITNGAILMLSLGEEQAAEVFKHLAPREVHKLGEAMARLTAVTREQIDGVIDNFHKDASEQTTLGMNTNEFVRTALTRALGNDKAGFLLDRILQGGDTSGIESLKWMDPATVAELIRNEHPQIIATILVHLERDHAAEILKRLGDRLRHEVVLRIATLDGVQPSALRDLNDVLTKLLSGNDNLKKTAIGGVRTAAEILNYIGSSIETAAIESVREHDEELAQKILDEMFVFENLGDLEDRAIQLVLREVQSESLVIALKGANEALREKIFKNMSSRAGEMLREDLDSKGPVKVSEVEAEQKEILKIVRRLAEEGQISMGGGDDDYV
ncbi:MAG: flagellar motor switch protein FliG [Betaproteobacteria bacterium]|nr:flagellar motor switch protein FliG [Betaproteobacteria bacterium]